MRGAVFALLLMLWPLASASAQIDVRTGEHSDFTRIVLTIPEDAEWQLGRRANGYILRVPDAKSYNLSGFFDIIPRQRITAVSQIAAEGDLLIDLDCLCNAQAFLFRPDTLVIDVRDGPPPPDSSFERALDSEVAVLRVDEPSNEETRYQVSQLRLIPLVPPRLPLNEIPMVRSESGRGDADIATQPLRSNLSDQDVEDAVSALESSIVAGLGNALSGGLLEADSDSARTISEGSGRQIMIGSGQGFPGIAARSSTDTAAVPDLRAPDQTQTGQTCLPDAYFDVAAWGDQRPFFEQLNPARRALVPEFEHVDEEAVTQLARLYVRFGFGREAIQTLGIDQVRSQERQYLIAMAGLVDGRQPELGLFDGQVSCASSVALWAVLASPTLPFDAKVDSSAVLTTFRSLPAVLQTVLSIPLSEKLLEIGNTDAALQVLGRVEKDDTVEAERVLADAALLDALGESDGARQTVSQAARSDPRASPELMTRFFEDGIEAGLAFSDADFLFADALLFEQSGAEAAGPLAAAQIKAYASVNRFADAIDLLATTAQQHGSESEYSLRNHIYSAATTRMGDIGFLRFVVTDEDQLLAPPVRNAIAERLIDLGFPVKAQEFLTQPVGSPETQEQQYLRALAAIASGEPQVAVAALAGRTTQRAQQITALARAAEQVAAALSANTADLNADMFTNGSDQRFEQLVGQVGQSAVSPDMPLASGRALLESATQSRAVVEDLLQTFAAPDDF